jgi:hypothetical protein
VYEIARVPRASVYCADVTEEFFFITFRIVAFCFSWCVRYDQDFRLLEAVFSRVSKAVTFAALDWVLSVFLGSLVRFVILCLLVFTIFVVVVCVRRFCFVECLEPDRLFDQRI